MKKVHVTCIWESVHTIEVPDDFEDAPFLDSFPDEALEEMSPRNAVLVDWEVRTAK